MSIRFPEGTLAVLELASTLSAVLAWLIVPSLGPWPLVLVLAGWIVRWRRTGRPSVRTALDWPLLAFVLTMALGVWSAYDQDAAWAKFWLLIGGLSVFYAFANWLTDGPANAAEWAGWLLAGYGAVIAFSWLLGELTTFDLVGGGLNPNISAGAMAMGLSFQLGTLYLAWRNGSKFRLAVGLGMLILSAAGLALSESRGAWIALALAGVVVLWFQVSRILAGGRRYHGRWFFGGLGLALLLAWLAVVIWSGELERALKVWTASDGMVDRSSLFRDGLMLAQDYPIVGAGLGGFMQIHASYAFLTHVGFSPHSHNLYLDLVIEQGVFALLAVLWLWLLMAEGVWRSMAVKRVKRRRSEVSAGRSPGKGTPQADRRFMLKVAALAVVTIAAHGLVDDALYASRGVVALFAPLAFAVPSLRKAEAPLRRQQLTVALVGLVALVFVSALWWRPLLSRVNSNLAAVQQAKVELGTYVWPEWPIQDAVRRESDLDQVIAGYERALSLDETNASAARRLGQIELSLGHYDLAVAFLETAYGKAPWATATRQLLGEAYIVTGRVELGAHLWKTARNGQDQLLLRHSWYDYLGDAERAELISRALGTVSKLEQHDKEQSSS